ncbi:site-specific integrase [Bradyrhizobium japonicum]|uniref:site-specific integrase n=1 Tax=Bradyrhizobium japonicum TaxID=375 RepID=UPI001B89E90D|nr:site-specific integrase [Bradyrhizobium japonicum]MBR0975235.1 site-specific integrase [Bradyrhizobium japonicum]
MARKVRHSALESPTARSKLQIRRRPYNGPSLGRGVALLYRRNKTNGTWVLKSSDGHGAYWTKAFALADDFEDSDGKRVLSFHQAQDAARKLARGEDGGTEAAPLSVDAALKAYRSDLEARQANAYNALWPRLHLTSVLLSKPVALLGADELTKWRNGLLSKMAPSTVNRLCRCVCAALELAAQLDKTERIAENRSAWQIGLSALPDAGKARNVILTDRKVREFVAEAYGLDASLGLLSDVLAITGARPSQVIRLLVADLHDHPTKPKLSMPRSGKGGSKNRAARRVERFSVPITPALAVKLREATKGRADDAPLLLQSDGTRWPDNPGQTYHRQIDKVVKAIGAGPETTAYALRHSSIVRRLLQRAPVRLVAALHDTSVKMIEMHYSRYITEHADDHARIGLLQDELPDNVTPMRAA